MPVNKPADLAKDFPAGHVLIHDEASEVLEFNPAAALADLMDHIERLASGAP